MFFSLQIANRDGWCWRVGKLLFHPGGRRRRNTVEALAMALLLASATELGAFTSVQDARQWSGIPDPAWDAIEEQTGKMGALRVVASLPASRIAAATAAATIVTTPADPTAGTSEGQRPLTEVERVQVGLTWRVARQKFALPDEDPLAPAATPRDSTPPSRGGTASGSAPTGPTAASTTATAMKDNMKIKMSAGVDQADKSGRAARDK